MHGENLLVDDCGDWQTVEAVCERLPQLDVISPLAFVVEAVNAVNRGTLVVASQDEEIFGIFDLVG